MKIYLAGKISKNDWRGNVVPNHRGRSERPWREHPTVLDGLECVGPYFEGCDHGCTHGPATHGVGLNGVPCAGELNRYWTVVECFSAIRACDVFFAWFGEDQCTAYGTLVELGYAAALGKKIVTAAPSIHGTEDCSGGHGCFCGSDDIWFAHEAASEHIVAATPEIAFKELEYVLKLNREAELAKCESPLEMAFYLAHVALDLPELRDLVAQYKVGKYRLDFAIPELKIGFEMDGRTYHNTDEAFERDRIRDVNLALEGWRIHRFGGDTVRANAKNVVRQAAQLVGAAR